MLKTPLFHHTAPTLTTLGDASLALSAAFHWFLLPCIARLA